MSGPKAPTQVALSSERDIFVKIRYGFAMVFPAMFIICFVLAVPLVYTVYCSLQDLDFMQFKGYIGLDNYQSLFQNRNILPSFGRTFLVTLSAMSISMILGLLLSLWIDACAASKAYLIEMVGLVPWVISMVVGALLWRWLLNNDLGLVNYFIRLMGGKGLSVFQYKRQAVILLIVVMAWRTIGYSMVMLLAGLKSIPNTLIEAAKVDGANRPRILWHVQLPLIKTPILISAIVLSMSNFNNNTVPMVLTSGGPGNATNVISLEMYKLTFSYFQFGKGSALALVIFLVNLLVTILYIKLVKYEV